MKNGFDRLRGAAVASVMGLGSLMAGSGRAAATGTSFRLTYNSSVAWGGAISGPLGILPFQTGASTGSSFNVQGVGNYNRLRSSLAAPLSTSGGFVLQNTTLNDTNFGVAEAGLFNVSALTDDSALAVTTSPAFLTDAFDQVLTWAVDGWLYANPTPTMDLNNAIVGDTMTGIIPGIDVQASLKFVAPYPVVRSIITLTNTTFLSIPLTATVMGDLGSDSGTQMQATSDGDTLNEPTDMWVVTSDTPPGIDAVNGDDPIITTSRYGAGGLAPTVGPELRLGDPDGSGGGEAAYMYHYAFTLPAKSSVSLMVFHGLSTTIADASMFAEYFENLVMADMAGLTSDLSDTDLEKIINYGDAAAAVAARAPVSSSSSSDSTFALGPLGLASLAGLAGLLRLKRKQRG